MHGAGDFGLALQTVRFEAANHIAGIKGLTGQVAQDIPMGGQDQTNVVAGASCQQFVQRVQVAAHVAVGRADDGGAAIEHMVAAEQQAVFFQHQAQVVGRVARRVDGAQAVGDAATLQHQTLAIGEFAFGAKAAVGPGRVGAGQPQDGRVVAVGLAQRLQGRRARRVVGVGMGAHNEAHIAMGGIEQPLQVRGFVGAGVDDDEAAVGLAHDVAVGAGTGHHAGVGRGQALHMAQQGHGPLALPIQVVQDLPIGVE